MSLIDEALKRARQEAARQDAAQNEARYARMPVYAPPSGQARRWLIPAVVAGCLALGIGVGLTLSRGGSPPSAEQRAQTVEPRTAAPRETQSRPIPAPATPPATPDNAPPIIEEAPVPEAARAEAPSELPQPRPAAPPVREEEALRPTTPASITLPPAASAPPAAAPAVPQETKAPPAAEPAQSPSQSPAQGPAQSYVRDVPVAGGGTLRLNGIAYSEQPVAIFGDKVVGPGESINGFTVVEIEPKRVKLQGQGGATLYVTLR